MLTCHRDRDLIIKGLGSDYAAILTVDTPVLAEQVQAVDTSVETLLARLEEYHAQTALVRVTSMT